MIICFTGTGNSRMVSDRLQDLLGDEVVRLAPQLMTHPELVELKVDDGRVIWVFPVHCWGLPRLTERVMRRARITADGEPLIHHMVCTCGDDIGYTDRQWQSVMRSRHWQTGSAFSVQMPNNYTFMRGFDVDPLEVAQAKLDAVDPRVEHIAEMIEGDRRDVVDVVRGSWPWVKSKVIRPWFMRNKMSTKPFHSNDSCVGCARCAINCPSQIIRMVGGRPRWGDDCTMCLRCYHCCTVNAVQYGKATEGKGQYLCPGYTLLSPPPG